MRGVLPSVGMIESYRSCIGTTQLLLQTIGVGLGNAGLVGVVEADNAAHTQESGDEHAEVEETLASADVGILLRTENTENLVLLVDGLAKVSLLLLIPPAAVRVSESALRARRVLVTTILPQY